MPSELQSETARRNNTTHGMLSKTIVIEGETAARFSTLLASLRTDLQPRNGIEDSLVEDLATCRWRQRRLLAMETACLTHEIRRQDPEAAAESCATRAVLAFGNLSTGSRTLELINRYELRFYRQGHAVPRVRPALCLQPYPLDTQTQMTTLGQQALSPQSVTRRTASWSGAPKKMILVIRTQKIDENKHFRTGANPPNQTKARLKADVSMTFLNGKAI